MIAAERLFAGRERLAWHLASDVAVALRGAIAKNGRAVLAVSGGTTPTLFFEKLSAMGLPWQHVTVTLVDERQVPETSERSNARLVKAHLLKDKAAAALFVPLFDNPEAVRIENFDVVVLGMGNDGHTASFFPGGDTLAKVLDPKGNEKLMAIAAPGSGEPRLTFTLPMVLNAPHILLHIEGPEKRATLDKALGEGPIEDMPVRAVLRSGAPVTLYWCR
jgi:6-phosphogluconolactonase